MSDTSTRIIDKKDGVWVINRTQYRLAHGEREGVTFNAGEPTKIVMDDWIKSQPVLAVIPDPNESDAPLPPPITTENPLVNSETGAGGMTGDTGDAKLANTASNGNKAATGGKK